MTTTAAPRHTDRARRPGRPDRITGREWAVLVVLCGAIFMEGIDVSMMGVALPAIRADLGLSTASLQWVVSAYVLGYGGFVLLGGRAADTLGRRRMFLLWLVVFIAFSGLGGLAHEGWVLVVARFVTGVAAAFLAPAGLSIITTTFPEGPLRNRAVLVYAGAAAGGFSLGLVAGGLLTAIDWRWVFFAPVVVASLLLAAALRLLPRDGRPAVAAGFDVAGALASTAGMVLVVLAVVQAHDAAPLRTAGVLALGAASLGAFVLVERRSPAPLLRLGLLRSAPAAAGERRRGAARRLVRRLPVRRRALPAGGARLVRAAHRAGAARRRQRRHPGTDRDAAAGQPLRQPRGRHGGPRAGRPRLRAVPAGPGGLGLRPHAAQPRAPRPAPSPWPTAR